MTEIKSAVEKAMEKVEKLEKASPAELKRMELVPLGNALAAKYIRGELGDLLAELSHQDSSVRSYLQEGMLETLLANICLPRDTRSKESRIRAVQGVLALKKNSKRVKETLEQMENLFTYYEAATQQTYTRLKQDFEAKLAESSKEMGLQLGGPVKIEVERHPQFQEEWRRMRASLDVQYERALEEQKQRILGSG